MYTRSLDARETQRWHARDHDTFRVRLRQHVTRAALRRDERRATIIDADGTAVATWDVPPQPYVPRSPEALVAGRLVSEDADARLGLGLGAHAMAEHGRYDTTHDPSVTSAIDLARESYRAATEEYVDAAHFYYTGRARRTNRDAPLQADLPDPLRTELRHTLALLDQAAQSQPALTPAHRQQELERLGGVAVQVRDRLEAHAPELFAGREPPFGAEARDRIGAPSR